MSAPRESTATPVGVPHPVHEESDKFQVLYDIPAKGVDPSKLNSILKACIGVSSFCLEV